ncbi:MULTISPECIES: hypothetical protein, partial [unclassified Collinsella]|uniref:hypothetical protein n=1 Tax=unclassified Collinsella TaxID=2637548 RepID=UPI0011C11794
MVLNNEQSYGYNWYQQEARCIESRTCDGRTHMKETEKIEIMHFDQEGYLEDGRNVYEAGK